MSRIASLFALACLIATTSCSSVNKFDPPLRAENDVITFEVEKARLKDRGAKPNDFQLWTRITNKTGEELVFVKNNYTATVDGKSYKGYVGHGIKLQRGFRMRPHDSKAMKFAFVGVPAGSSEAAVEIKNIGVEGKDGKHAVSIKVPMQQPGKTN